MNNDPNKVYYFISNSDNQIHKTDEPDLFFKWEHPHTDDNILLIETSDGEVIDTVTAYESLGDLIEVVNGGGNDLE